MRCGSRSPTGTGEHPKPFVDQAQYGKVNMAGVNLASAGPTGAGSRIWTASRGNHPCGPRLALETRAISIQNNSAEQGCRRKDQPYYTYQPTDDDSPVRALCSSNRPTCRLTSSMIGSSATLSASRSDADRSSCTRTRDGRTWDGSSSYGCSVSTSDNSFPQRTEDILVDPLRKFLTVQLLDYVLRFLR